MKTLHISLLPIIAVLFLLSSCASLSGTGPAGEGDKPTLALSKSEIAAEDVTVIQCPPLTKTGSCQVSHAGNLSAGGLRVFGDILAGDVVYKNGGIRIDSSGRIQDVGCITATDDTAILSCPEHVISPGLINPHDHLSYNQNFPGGQNPGTTPSNPDYSFCNNPQNAFASDRCRGYRYDRRNEWRKGLEGKPAITAPWGGKDEAVVWNELRHVMAGATTVAGSGGMIGLVRNPDVEGLMEGLVTRDNKHVDYKTFPLGDTSDVTGHDFGDCRYPNVVTPAVLDNLIFLPHVAEGINEFAQNELFCLTGTGDGSVALQAPNSTFIHAVAANPLNANTVKQAGMTLVWSPRSNLSLYGNTAQVSMYDNMGIRVALSSDWTPSGSINMLREMACAADYNKTYLDKHFSRQDLWKMSTINAAHALGIDDQTGLLAKGYWADIAIYNPIGKGYTSYYDPMIYSNVGDVSLVLRGGRPLYGDEGITRILDSRCETINNVCGSNKAVCLSETGYSFATIKNFNQNSYPLFYCDVPADEPSCIPARYGQYSGRITSSDADGDGIGDSTDNCLRTFNPIRPMDNGRQADYNGNGIGDACDSNPLGARTTK